MRARTIALPVVRTGVAWSAAALAGAVALYLQAMAPPMLAVLRFGAICTGHAAFAPHCPACYVAAAIAAGAAGSMCLLFATPKVRDGR